MSGAAGGRPGGGRAGVSGGGAGAGGGSASGASSGAGSGAGGSERGAVTASAPGEVCGRYRLIEALGKGGMAEVFLAEPLDGRGPARVAIKRLLPHFAADRRFVDMMRDEAHIARAIRHPNVAAVFDVGEAGGRPYLAMEYVDGVDLGRVLRAYRNAGRRMPLAAALLVTHRAALGLGAAHALVDASGRSLGVVHRDVSPHNMLVGRDGAVKIIDFGVAKAASNSSRTRSGVIKGKLQYMSPEQARAEGLDARADLFSLGMSLFKLITGRLPFEGANEYQIYDQILRREAPSPRRDVPDLPPRVEALVLRSLRKARDRRFQSAHEMAELLALALREVDPRYDEAALARELARLLAEHAARPRTAEDEEEEAPAAPPAEVEPLSEAAVDQLTFAPARTRVERRTRVVGADEAGNIGAAVGARGSIHGPAGGGARPVGARGTAVVEVAPEAEGAPVGPGRPEGRSEGPRPVPVARPAWGPAVATVDALVSEPAPERTSNSRERPRSDLRVSPRVAEPALAARGTALDVNLVPTVAAGADGRARRPLGRDTPSGVSAGGRPLVGGASGAGTDGGARSTGRPLAIPVPGLGSDGFDGPVSLPAMMPPGLRGAAPDATLRVGVVPRADGAAEHATDPADADLVATAHAGLEVVPTVALRAHAPGRDEAFDEPDPDDEAFDDDDDATSTAWRDAQGEIRSAARPEEANLSGLLRPEQGPSDPSLPAAELAEGARPARRSMLWLAVGTVALLVVAALSAVWVINAEEASDPGTSAAAHGVLRPAGVSPTGAFSGPRPEPDETVAAVPQAAGSAAAALAVPGSAAPSSGPTAQASGPGAPASGPGAPASGPGAPASGPAAPASGPAALGAGPAAIGGDPAALGTPGAERSGPADGEAVGEADGEADGSDDGAAVAGASDAAQRPEASPGTEPGVPAVAASEPASAVDPVEPEPIAEGPTAREGPRNRRNPPGGRSTPAEQPETAPASRPAKPPVERRPVRPATRRPPPGRLTVNALPWAHVEIDGRRLERNTPIQNLPLPPGRHKVVLISPDGETHTAVITLESGGTARVVHRFK